MIKKKFLLFYFLLFILSAQSIDAQRLFRKKSPAQKASEDLRKRQQQAGEGNAFNPIQPDMHRPDFSRDDYIWTSETAYSSSKKTGNISLTTPSRYGLGKNFEISTMLPLNYFVPNLILKKSYPTKRFIFAHRHALYSSTPGLIWAQKNHYGKIVASDVDIPVIVAIRNELIVSYPFKSDPVCSTGLPFLIITAGVALDAGFAFEQNNLNMIDEHFLGSRSPALTGKGAQLSTRLRVDVRLTDFLLIESDVKFFFGKFINNNFSLEQHTGLQFFLTRNVSFTVGYTASYGYFSTKNFMIFPNADLSFYFGKKNKRDLGLFGKKGPR